MRRFAAAALVMFCAACGGHRHGAPPLTSPIFVHTQPPSPPPPSTVQDDDHGVLLSPSGTTVGGMTLIARDDGVELPSGQRVKIEPGEAELVSEHWVVYRDLQNRLRARELAFQDVAAGSQPVKLSLGDTAVFPGGWKARWVSVREGLIELEGEHRAQRTGKWSASPDPRAATHELASTDGLAHFKVTLTKIDGRPDHRLGSIMLVGEGVDKAERASFGQPLAPGLYSFPDGLRVRVIKTSECDFDVSVPCPFGGSYRAEVALESRSDHAELKSKVTRLLEHSIELGKGSFVVRK